MSNIDFATLARRICDQSGDISKIIGVRAYVDHRFVEPIKFQSVWPEVPMGESLTVDEQKRYHDELDRLDEELDEMCRLTRSTTRTEPNKRPSVSRQNSLKRSVSITGSRDNLHTLDDMTFVADDTRSATMATPVVPAEPLITADAIRAFNASSGQTTDGHSDVEELCNRDKQTFRSMFHVTPKLLEFLSKIEQIVANGAEQRPSELPGTVSDEKFKDLSVLIERINSLLVDIQYLEQHPNVYNVAAVPTVVEPVYECLDELCTQIMNQSY